MEQNRVGRDVQVSLYPANYETVEMVNDQGEEMTQPDFTPTQLFAHSIQELHRLRVGKKKRRIDAPDDSDGASGTNSVRMEENQLDSDNQANNEGDVIDPRIHYRPVVSELQFAISELHQLINSIDLIKRHEFLQEMYCMRENTAPKKEELEFLIESKSSQINEASQILLAGVDALTKSLEKENVFFKGITQLIGKWRICAPFHGNIPKPFRAGEPLAIDCSYWSAGSTFVPSIRSLSELASAEISRTEKGLVQLRPPEEHLPRTLRMELLNTKTGAMGSHTLLPPVLNHLTKPQGETLDTVEEELALLRERNEVLLKAVQFSVFCEEVFSVVVRESLGSSANWAETAHPLSNYGSINGTRHMRTLKNRSAPQRSSFVAKDEGISVVQVLDDQVQLRVDQLHMLSIQLIDARTLKPDERRESTESSNIPKSSLTTASSVDVEMMDSDVDAVVNGKVCNSNKMTLGESGNGFNQRIILKPDETAYYSETCRLALLLLQQEVRQQHGRREISRGQVFTSEEEVQAIDSKQPPNSTAPTGARYLARSTTVLYGLLQILAHELLKNEICLYLDELSSALALQASQFSSSRCCPTRSLDDSSNQPVCDSVKGVFMTPRWKICTWDSTVCCFDLCIGKNSTSEIMIRGTSIWLESGSASVEVAGIEKVKIFVEQMICTQVCRALFDDARSLGLKKVIMELNKARVRIFSAGEWNGMCLGEGRVPENKPIGSIFLEPHLNKHHQIEIRCLVQAVGLSSTVETITVNEPALKGQLHLVEWNRLPGDSDLAKLHWLLQQSSIASLSV